MSFQLLRDLKHIGNGAARVGERIVVAFRVELGVEECGSVAPNGPVHQQLSAEVVQQQVQLRGVGVGR